MKNQPKIILISLLGLIISAGLFLFVIRPTVDKILNLNIQVSSKKTDLKQLEEQIVIYKNSQRDLSLASGKDVISQSLLKREDLQVAIVEIENASALTQTGESMTIIDNGGKSSSAKPLISGKSFLDEVQYNIKTTSNFVQLLDLMKYLENLPHFTEIAKFTLQASATNPNSKGVFIQGSTIISSIDSVFFVQKK